MSDENPSSNVTPLSGGGAQRLVLDERAIEAAKRSIQDGAVTPSWW